MLFDEKFADNDRQDDIRCTGVDLAYKEKDRTTCLVYNPTNCVHFIGSVQIQPKNYAIIPYSLVKHLQGTDMILEGDINFPQLWAICLGDGKDL